ncbi:MAG: hypothetical protein ABI041_08015 [Bdellovibrionia bacterium]
MAEEFIKTVEALGKKIDDAWQKQSYRRAVFPDIAAKELSHFKCHEQFQLEDFLLWVGRRNGCLPQPLESSFGDPPILLFDRNSGFYIEALIWWFTPVVVHDHSFQGAWQVISGLTLHDIYNFEKTISHNSILNFGKIEHIKTELLPVGFIRPITAGPSFIHRTVHLQKPTVSLVVRTAFDTTHPQQFNYYKDNIALRSHSFHGAFNARINKIASLLTEMKSNKKFEFFQQYIKYAPVPEVIDFLIMNYDCAFGIDGIKALISKTHWKDEPWTEMLVRSIDSYLTSYFLRDFTNVHDHDQRLLLSMLTSGMSRTYFMKLFPKFFPKTENFAEFVSNHLFDLSQTTSLTFEMNEKGRDIVAARLTNGSAEKAFYALSKKADWIKTDNGRDTFHEYSNTMDTIPLFKTLFGD